MNTVKTLLGIKGHKLWSIKASQTVYDAIASMAELDVGALPVLDDDSRMVGIISERDFVRKVILKNLSPRETNVADIMTTSVICVEENTTTEKCMSLMVQKKIRHLPVIKGGKPIGMVNVADVMNFTIKEQSMTIEELQNYIMDETGGDG